MVTVTAAATATAAAAAAAVVADFLLIYLFLFVFALFPAGPGRDQGKGWSWAGLWPPGDCDRPAASPLAPRAWRLGLTRSQAGHHLRKGLAAPHTFHHCIHQSEK